jgi:hypothetical protein
MPLIVSGETLPTGSSMSTRHSGNSSTSGELVHEDELHPEVRDAPQGVLQRGLVRDAGIMAGVVGAAPIRARVLVAAHGVRPAGRRPVLNVR